jgi:hypothetical protein
MDPAPTTEVIRTGLPVWTVLVVAFISATGPLVFTALWKRFTGAEHKEHESLVSDAAATAVTGASALINELQSEREYLLRTVKELRVQVDELLLAKARADRLTDQVARLETDLLTARAERDAAHAENLLLAKRVEALESELASLRSELTALENEGTG